MAKKEYIYATGKRKASIARVNIIPGTGKITINKKDINEIYTLDTLKAIVLKPFTVTNMMEKYDVEATVTGGGFVGQAGAISHGIAKALATTDPHRVFILCVFLKKTTSSKSTGYFLSHLLIIYFFHYFSSNFFIIICIIHI